MKNEGKLQEDGTMDETMRILLEENPILHKAHEKYLAFTMDPELVDAYESRMKWKRDQEYFVDDAMKKGMAKGMLHSKRETAKKCWTRDMTLMSSAN